MDILVETRRGEVGKIVLMSVCESREGAKTITAHTRLSTTTAAMSGRRNSASSG